MRIVRFSTGLGLPSRARSNHRREWRRHVVAGLGASSEATVFAGQRSSAAGAALANGIASHILELDDVHKGSTMHAAAPVIPAALAVAERAHATGEAFLLAVTVGYDAALRVGEAVNPSHYRFWHPTGTAATFGAAVAAGSLLGLGADQMLDALGSAGTQAAGLWEFNADGAMSKHLHPGKAAFNGVLAADLARAGFTGARRILEGERGFFRATSTDHDESRIIDGLGERWKISENCYKVWACCGHTHSAIDVARKMRAQRAWSAASVLRNVTAVRIETYGPGYEIVKEPNPSSSYAAKFSSPTVSSPRCSTAAPRSSVFAAENFSNAGVVADDAAELLRRTTVTVAPDLTAKYPSAWPTRVCIELADGTVVNATSDYPVGNPENPVTTMQLEEKFATIVGPRWGGDVVRRALDVVRDLASVRDMSTVFRDFGDHLGAAIRNDRHQPALSSARGVSQGVRELCAPLRQRVLAGRRARSPAYPEEFVKALTDAGWLAALIPDRVRRRRPRRSPKRRSFSKRSTAPARTPARATRRCTSWARCCGTDPIEQKQRYLPKIASGELRLQSFAVTEPTTGTDTTKLKTFAERRGDRYVVNGQKVWISRVQHSDLMLLLARTTPARTT